MKSIQLVIALLLVATIAVSFQYYDAMPDYMASHWNAAGEVDGYMEKGVSLYLVPGIMLFVVLFFYIIPYIDPLRENIMKFEQYYEGFIFMIVLFLCYVHLLSLAWNLGYEFDMGRMMVPGLGVLFIYIGMMCGRCKQNWFIGIRTPWTLSSEQVWEKTHVLAEKVFIFLGALWIVLGILMPSLAPYLIGLVVLGALYLFVYSYLEYKKEKDTRAGPSLAAAKAECACLCEEDIVAPAAEPMPRPVSGRKAAPAKKKRTAGKGKKKKSPGRRRASKSKK